MRRIIIRCPLGLISDSFGATTVALHTPEDVGGTISYENYLEAMQDSDHEEHEATWLWRGPFEAGQSLNFRREPATAE